MNKWLRIVWPPIFATLVVCATVWATGSLTTPNTIFTQPNPVPTSKLDANWTAHATYINAREISFGLQSARPTAGVAGRYYFSTDSQIFSADNGTAWVQLAPAVSAPSVGALTGLTLSNSGSASIGVAVGAASSDDAAIADRVLISNTTAFTKKPGTAWAVGTAQGCLDTGSPAVFTWYHVFLITRLDTGVVDALCSTSATSPTMPSNYTKKRRIGSVRTTWFATAGAEIYPFSQVGDRFVWATMTSTLDVNNATPGTSAVTATLSTPNGVPTVAILHIASPQAGSLYVSELSVSDEIGETCGTGAAGTAVFCQGQVYTDSASSVRFRSTQNAAITIRTHGWIDRRGQQ